MILPRLIISVVAVFLIAPCFAQAQGKGKGQPKNAGQLDAQPAPPTVPLWIDTHAHLRVPAGQGYSGAVALAADLTQNARLGTLVLLPQPQPDPGGNAYDYSDFANILKNYPGRFSFLGGNLLNQMIARIPADKVTDTIKAEFAREAAKVLAAGAAGFGEISILHLSFFPGHPFQNVPADHPLLLQLADIAVGKIIDIHMAFYDRDGPRPDGTSDVNPPILRKNTDGLERLLAHNRGTNIMLAHFGSDVTGQWSNEASRRLLSANPNLYMSIKLVPPLGNSPLTEQPVAAAWIALIREFPDRFVIGTDSFFGLGGLTAYTPGPVYRFLMGLPDDVRSKIAWENAARLYGLPAPGDGGSGSLAK